LLIMSAHLDTAFLHANLPASVPAVLLNSAVKSASYAVLNIDNYGGAYAMVRHLLGAGRSSVTLIAGPAGNFDAQQRELGYRAAMAKYAPHAPLDVVAGDFNEESGYLAGQQLVAREQRPSAVFAANDMMAVGCLYAFKDAGVEVPRDIALAGFDDIPIARYVTPPLSTVRVRIADLGRSALEQLAAMLEEPHQDTASTHTLDCEIVTRETCGANLTKVSPAHAHRSSKK
jgi:LacI family transcriptional regulator